MSLIGVALLIGLDRRILAPRWSVPVAGHPQGGAQDEARYHAQTFSVIRVDDGDTLDIDAPEAGARCTRVRLLGIDAPEMGAPDEPQVFFAGEAATYARRFVQGMDVTVYLDENGPSRGKYGRLLAYIEMADGRFLNELLVSEGYAYADLRFKHSYYHNYRQLEASARALRKGLWDRVSPEQWPSWRQRMEPSPRPQ